MEEALHKPIRNFFPSLSLFYSVLTSCKDNQVWPPDLYFMKPFPVSSSPQFHNRRKTAVLSRSGRKETESVEEEEGKREAGEWGLLLTASHLCSVSKCLPGTVLFCELGTVRGDHVIRYPTVELTEERETLNSYQKTHYTTDFHGKECVCGERLISK